MISFTTYLATGEILSSGTCQEDMLEAQANPEKGILVIQGGSDFKTQYILNGEIVNKPVKPTDGAYSFNYSNKQWVQNISAQEAEIKLIRNNLLLQSDWTDTYSAPARLGEEKYTAWQIYRQQLRDITTQPGYPYQITWPQAPQ